MYTELLDVVDQNDQVIDRLPRYQIHAQGLCHRAVHILVFNQQGDLFLQKRSMKKDFNKGLWDTSAAGHVDAGENYLSSAVREIKEELGIEIEENLQAIFKLSPLAELGMEFIQVYRCTHDGPFILNIDEIDQGEWFSAQSISQRVGNNDSILTATFKSIWNQHIGNEQ